MSKDVILSSKQQDFSCDLLEWYRRNARSFPWRVPYGSQTPQEPYRVWLSEVMLQQTTTTAAVPYFLKFIEFWPKISDLAQASLDDVLRRWAGLGYYTRARKLKECAETVVDQYDGVFPDDYQRLIALPGIGPYTAGAILAIAFQRRVGVVDGNIERILARMCGLRSPLNTLKSSLRSIALELTPDDKAGDYVQALMDLGAGVCTPKTPKCEMCPVGRFCASRKNGWQHELPIRAVKQKKPQRYGAAFVVVAGGAILVRRRPLKGLLGGLLEVPNTPWQQDRLRKTTDYLQQAPYEGSWKALETSVEHTFTHFKLRLNVFQLELKSRPPAPQGSWWLEKNQIENEAFSSLMRKVLTAAT